MGDIIIMNEPFSFQDFPRNSYEPKDQLPFYTKPGECPRKIEVERFVI
jgi:hypothetical protein